MEDSLLANLKNVMSTYRWRLVSAVLMVAASNILLILNPLIFRQAVIAIAPQTAADHEHLNPFFKLLLGPNFGSIWAWTALLIVVALLSAFLKYRMRLGFFSVSRDVELAMRHQIFARIQEQSMAFYDRHGTGELLSRLTNDISAYRDMLGPGIMYPMFFITLVFPALIALFFLSYKLAFLSLIPLLTIPLFNQGIRNHVYNYSITVQKKLADLSNMTQEHYSGIRLIKGYVIENNVFKRFGTLCKELLRANLKLVSILGMIFPFFTMLTKVVTVLLVLLFGAIILKAWGELSPADFVSFMWIQSYIFFPMLMLGWVLPIYARGSAAYHRLIEIYKEPIEVQEGTQADLEIEPKADIVFNNLSYTYPNTLFPALSNLQLAIKGGAFIGITGPVGAGKSTLFKLLNREYEIPAGKIFIGKQDLRDFTFDALHRAIVTVEQSPFLFSKTIAENVSFGNEDATQMELERVAQYADLHETVVEFPESYNTIIGERGVTLSGGQKQRVALARAFLVKRSILLLDDIFSAIDSTTERKIFHSLKTHFKGKTVMLITHRVSILEQMDRVLYMQAGKIVEDGTPQELLEKNGHYAALAEIQKQ